MTSASLATAHPDSYYAATAKGLKDRPLLAGEVACDVCIIGGGFTGLSAALHLAERDYRVVLLEGRRVGWGASGRNGGQLGSGQRKDPGALVKLVGEDDARLLWELAEEAKATVKARIDRHAIDCDLTPGVMSVAYKPGDVGDLEAYADFVEQHYGYHHLQPLGRSDVAERLGSAIYHGGLLDRDAGHLHPLNYALGLARAAEEAGAELYEGSHAVAIDSSARPLVRTPGGSVRTRYLVLACNGYLGGLEPRIAGKIMPINNFMLASEPLDEAGARALIRDDVAVADTKFVVDYYRLSADRRLLFGGGETYRQGFPADLKGFVRKYMLRVFPQLAETRIDYAWGGTLAITLNRLPTFGRLEPAIFYAQGYSGHGVALTSLAGKLIAEAVAGTAERFDVFARLPTPSFPGGTLLRWPGLVAGMLYYSLRDRL